MDFSTMSDRQELLGSAYMNVNLYHGKTSNERSGKTHNSLKNLGFNRIDFSTLLDFILLRVAIWSVLKRVKTYPILKESNTNMAFKGLRFGRGAYAKPIKFYSGLQPESLSTLMKRVESRKL